MLNMTSKENRQADASRHAVSIARWEDEGGAATPRIDQTDIKQEKKRRPRRMIANKREGSDAAHTVRRG